MGLQIKGMKRIFALSTGVFLIFSLVLPCEYNIRDAGFVAIGDLPYSLYYYIDDRTPEENAAHFEKMSRLIVRESNISPTIVHIHNQKNHPAMDYYRFWEIQAPPTLIMVSPDQRSIHLPLPPGQEMVNESLWLEIEKAASSPLREEILEHIVKSYAIILLIEGRDAGKNLSAQAKIEQAAGNISSFMNQLPKRIENPPHMIVVPAEVAQREEILLWSLDIDPESHNAPQIAVLFGRGRILYSPFKSEAITVSDLTAMLSIMGLSCDCGLDKRGMMGLRIPLRWDSSVQAEVVEQLGFDAENPLIKREITGILSANNLMEGAGEETDPKLQQLGLYRERAMAFDKKFAGTRISPAQSQRLNSPESRFSETGFTALVPLLAVLLLGIALLGGVILIRRRAMRNRA
jgi:hypothetical protein